MQLITVVLRWNNLSIKYDGGLLCNIFVFLPNHMHNFFTFSILQIFLVPRDTSLNRSLTVCIEYY